jgi:hypothetical protein
MGLCRLTFLWSERLRFKTVVPPLTILAVLNCSKRVVRNLFLMVSNSKKKWRI